MKKIEFINLQREIDYNKKIREWSNERLILIENMAEITEKGDSKRIEIDFHDWEWIIDLAKKALTIDDIEHDLTTAQK